MESLIQIAYILNGLNYCLNVQNDIPIARKKSCNKMTYLL